MFRSQMGKLTSEELLRKVRKIEITTKALSSQVFAGRYHSAFKGRGMAFSEVRAYQWGDDVRSMDWNVTARMGEPFVKVFEEERELTVILMVDVSRSELFGTAGQTKRDRLAELASVLSFSAIQNNDKVGALLFSDTVGKFIPPSKGCSHLLQIIREVLEFEPSSPGTDISAALRFLTGAVKKKSTVFLLSDMMDCRQDGTPAFEDALKVAVSRHDLSVIRVFDPMETSIPRMGLVHIKDSETGKGAWVNTDSASVRSSYEQYYRTFTESLDEMLRRYKVDSISVSTVQDYVKSLMTLFGSR